MTKIILNDGWKLFICEYNEKSPLKDHGPMEIGADDERKNLFVYEIMVRTYGLDSVSKSCNKYIKTR